MNGNTDANSNGSVDAVIVTDVLNDKMIIILADLTDRNEIFTAFDITKQMRIENPTLNIPHEDIKEMVFEEWKNTICDDYDRTLTELTVGHSYVYHPCHESAENHPLAVKPVTPTPTKSPPVRVSDPDSMLTVEKRLNIDKMLLVNLGLVPGKLVKVETTNNVMSLSATTDTSGTTLVVNADGRLRLNARTLTKAFGSLPKQYDIYSNSDVTAIIVKPTNID